MSERQPGHGAASSPGKGSSGRGPIPGLQDRRSPHPQPISKGGWNPHGDSGWAFPGGLPPLHPHTGPGVRGTGHQPRQTQVPTLLAPKGNITRAPLPGLPAAPSPNLAQQPPRRTQLGRSRLLPGGSATWPGLGHLYPWPASKVTEGGGHLGLMET